MTVEIGKDVTDKPETAEGVVEKADERPAEAQAPTPPAERPARPARRKVRRVRVIEVIDDEDDEDLQEVLQALEEGDAAAGPDGERPGPAPDGGPAGRRAGTEAPEPAEGTENTGTAASTTPARPAEPAKAAEAGAEPAGDASGDTAGDAGRAGAKRRLARPGPRVGRGRARPSALRDGRRLIAGVAVVAVAALATGTVLLWRSQAELSAREEARREVTEVVTDYGNVVLSYDRKNLKASVERARSFLTGDALAAAKRTDVDRLQKSMDEGEFTLTSKTDRVYVGTVEGRFATAVLVFDITIAAPTATQSVTRNYLSLSLVRENGTWKISQQRPAGRETDTTADGGTLPDLDRTSAPSPSPTAKD